MWGLVLLVLFVVVLALWFLALIGAAGERVPQQSSWLAFIACLILGVIVFALTWRWAFPGN